MADVLESERRWTTGRALLTLWSAVLLGPIAWILHLNVSYAVATLACAGGRMILIATTLLTLAIAAAGGWIGWRVWSEIGPGSETDGSVIGRSRFMGAGGLALSVLFAVVILVQSIPPILYTSCE